MSEAQLEQQIAFLIGLDRLKGVVRRSYITTSIRPENSAEHSWHAALTAMLLAEYVDEEFDLSRTIAMLLVHDLPEIEAGDTNCYDDEAVREQKIREEVGAEKVFGSLPEGQSGVFQELWEEFEANQTPEARFANAIDRLIPLLQSVHTGGKSWRENGIRAVNVRDRNSIIGGSSRVLWEYASSLIEEAVASGLLRG
jgi:putative hydrolase of HD superfamily